MREPLFKHINHFWDRNKKAPQEIRNGLVEDFINELLEKGYSMHAIKTEKMRHPSIRIKDKRQRFTALDILADFILNVDMVREKNKEEYPVYNAEAEYNREQKRKEKEIPYHKHFKESDDEDQ